MACSGGCSRVARTPRAPLDAGGAALSYRLPEFALTMQFRPTDFTQVNLAINRVLVTQAVRQLDPAAR